MNKISKYMFMLFALAVVSCEKPSLDSPADVELVPEAGYIRFSTGVATKAPMIENLRGKSFGVFGYSYGYSTKWDNARPLAMPELFYNHTVDCSDEGVCTYDINSSVEGNQLKPWDLSRKYSFFAYYPMATNVNGISISAANAVNMPTVTYDLPLKSHSEGEIDPDSILDLMTAYAVDKTAGDGKVGFTFQHRLFCIEVFSQNFNTTKMVKVKDNNGEEMEQEIDADEIISNLTLTINNLAYESITVPMMKGDSKSAPTMVANSHGPVTFRLLESNDKVTVPSQDEGVGAVSLSRDKYIMLIPQDASGTKLTGTLSFDTTDANGNTLSYKLSESENETDNLKRALKFETDLNFEEGKKYNMTLSFTGKTVVIATAKAGSWEASSVNHEFE